MKQANIAVVVIALATLEIGLAASSFAEGDPEKGERVYRKCQACHSIVPGGTKKTGPSLFGIVGRQAGTGDYNYSDSLVEAGDVGLNWSEATLDAYLLDAKSFLAGFLDVRKNKVRDKMNFKLRNDGQRADVIAYLQSLSE